MPAVMQLLKLSSTGMVLNHVLTSPDCFCTAFFSDRILTSATYFSFIIQREKDYKMDKYLTYGYKPDSLKLCGTINTTSHRIYITL